MKRRKKRITSYIAIALAAIVLLGIALGIFGNTKTEEQITEIAELGTKRIVIQSGTMFSADIRRDERINNAELYYELTSADCLAFLLMNKADAFVTDNVIAQQIVRKNDTVTLIGEPLNEAYYGIAFEKGDPIQHKFNSIISEMKSDGTLDELENKWFGDDESIKTVPEQTWDGKNGTLTCAVSPDIEPSAYFNADGEFVGYDVDMVLEIARRLDYKLEFVTENFSAVLSDAATGMADLACGCITITDERLEMMDFSDPYLAANGVFIVRNAAVADTRDGVWMDLQNSLRRVFVEEDPRRIL